MPRSLGLGEGDGLQMGVCMANGALGAPGKGMSKWTGRRGSQVRVTIGMWVELASRIKSLRVCVCVCVCVFGSS